MTQKILSVNSLKINCGNSDIGGTGVESLSNNNNKLNTMFYFTSTILHVDYSLNKVRLSAYVDLFSILESIRSWSKDTLPFGSVNRAFDNFKRHSTKKMKRSRLIQKNGECNVSHMNIAKKERQYIR